MQPRRRRQSAGARSQIGRVRTRNDHKFLCPEAGRGRGRGGFLQQGMGVDAAKPEGIHRRPPLAARRLHPRPRFGVQIQRRGFDPEAFADAVRNRRRQGLVIQCQRGLDQPRRPRRRYAMPDHRLDRPDGGARQPVPGPRTINPAQGIDFRAIPQRDARPMRLDQPRRGGACHPRIGQGSLNRQHLAFQSRRQQPRALAVRGLADPLQHRIDPVARRLRILDALQRQHAQALTHQRAVTAFGEGPHIARLRQGAQLVEHHIDLCGNRGIDPPRQHQIAAPRAQFHHRRLHRQQRGRTSRVDDVVRPAQVQPVGDAPRHHIRRQARRRVRVERRQALGHFRPHPVQHRRVHLRQQLAQQLPRLVQYDAMLHG